MPIPATVYRSGWRHLDEAYSGYACPHLPAKRSSVLAGTAATPHRGSSSKEDGCDSAEVDIGDGDDDRCDVCVRGLRNVQCVNIDMAR